MLPSKLSVFNLFERPLRYLVPLYQRQYVWNEQDQWAPLWDDIRAKADAVRDAEAAVAACGPVTRPANHFLGAVVITRVPTFGRQVTACEVIDGQQRLTTLQILLAALRDVAARAGDPELTETLTTLTWNAGMVAEEHERLKVWPTNADRTAFTHVLTSSDPTGHDATDASTVLRARYPLSAPSIVQAYRYFAGAIGDYANPSTAEAAADADEGSVETTTQSDSAGLTSHSPDSTRLFALFQALRDHLHVVQIELEDGDDPQVIFETLNARGAPLLPSDLLRNFLFLQAARRPDERNASDRLYRDYWQAYDEAPDAIDPARRFWKVEVPQGRMLRPRLDLFLFHYLTYRTGQEVSIGHLFQAFRDWYVREHASDPVEAEFTALQEHSAVFRRLFTPDGDSRLDVFARRVRALDTSTAYPLVLYLTGDEHRALAPAELDGALTDIESFLVRRAVCGLTSKNYNNVFLGLVRTLRREPVLDRAAVRRALLAGTADTNRWPDNSEFGPAWLFAPMYKRMKGAGCQMVLRAVNDALHTDRNERVRVEGDLQVEHVLPVAFREEDYPLALDVNTGNPDAARQAALDRRQAALHSFGNLTLLTDKLNKEISNGPFRTKRPRIASQSLLRLNTYFQTVGDAEPWTDATIFSRGLALLETAARVWPHPSTEAPAPIA